MKKVICGFLVASMVLFFVNMVMAETPSIVNYVSMYDARTYHESIPGGAGTVGGWQYNVNFVKELPSNPDTGPDELLAWTNDVQSKLIEFENALSGNTYSTHPRFCYNTTTMFSPDGPVVGARACDAVVWFGNQLNVTDGVTTNNNMANMEVYVDRLYQRTLITPDTSRLNLFPYPEILGGKKAMSIVGDRILIYYNAPNLPNTRLDLLVFDSNGSTAFRQNGLIRGGQTFIEVDSQYSGLSARFQMQTTDSLPTVRKSTVFRLP